jgi:DNA-binding PucR family transcriptional regulator
MKNQVVRNLSGLAVVLALSSASCSAQAGWLEETWSETKSMASSLWDDTKEASADAWQDTKEVSSEAWEDTKKASANALDKVTPESSDENSLSDIKKLADKETYVKAWEGIKESAKNPSEPNADENGIPKE